MGEAWGSTDLVTTTMSTKKTVTTTTTDGNDFVFRPQRFALRPSTTTMATNKPAVGRPSSTAPPRLTQHCTPPLTRHRTRSQSIHTRLPYIIYRLIDPLFFLQRYIVKDNILKFQAFFSYLRSVVPQIKELLSFRL